MGLKDELKAEFNRSKFKCSNCEVCHFVQCQVNEFSSIYVSKVTYLQCPLEKLAYTINVATYMYITTVVTE